MAQNFEEIGIDISSFSSDKAQTLQKFIDLFTQLNNLSKSTINPVFGTGLVDFNKSLSETIKLLSDLNTKMSELNKSLGSGNTTKAASATKELTAEQAKLKVQTQEANKALLDYAKSQNASVQAREASKRATQDQIKAEKQLEDARKQAIAQNNDINKKLQQQEKQLEDARKQASIENKRRDAEAIKGKQEESRVTQKLISDLTQLKQAQKDQMANYANLFITHGGAAASGGIGPNSTAGINNIPAVKAAYTQLEETSLLINTIEENLNKAKGASRGFGDSLATSAEESGNFSRALTSGLSTLRTLAYILPGIGIAGIFNLAFEAISEAASSLGIFKNETQEIIAYQTKLNQLFLDQMSILEKTNSMEREVTDVKSNSLIEEQKAIELQKQRGVNQDKLLKQELDLSKATLEKSKLNQYGGDKAVDERIKNAQDRVVDLSAQLSRLSAIEDQNAKADITKDYKLPFRDVQTGVDLFGEDQFKKKRESLEKELEVTRLGLAQDTGYYAKYYRDRQDMLDKSEAYEKYLEDQRRRIRVETTKENLSLSISEQKRTLEAIISTEKEKANALKTIRNKELAQNQNDLYNVINNNSSNKDDIEIAENRKRAEDIRVNSKYKDELHQQTEDYNKRRIDAEESITKALINEETIRNEKVANNEQKSLDERLDALVRYTKARQDINDLEYEKDASNEKFKSKDPTVLKELEDLNRQRLEQKANIQADIERKVYDIVYQSTQKQLKLILDENTITIEKNKEAYGQKVRDLTDSFRAQKISYKKYKDELKIIDDQYAAQALDKTIEQDKQAVEAIRSNLKQNVLKYADSSNEVSDKQNSLVKAKEGGSESDILSAQGDYDAAVGKFNGYKTSVQQGEKALGNAIDKQKDDEFKRNNIRLSEDEKTRKQWMQAIKQTEQSLYNSIKEIGDREYEYKKQKVEREKALVDELYNYEIAGIQRSSLTAKDKNALDVQLNAQKMQRDLMFEKEQKRIAHDKAVFDKEISIAHIILSTAEAVASLIEIPPLAIAAGVAGAAELAVASQVQIPSYAEGTDFHKGGKARYGEAGMEVVIEPHKSPYLVNQETIGVLPIGTRVIPVEDAPELGGSIPKDDSWKQFVWLAKQFKKAMPDNKIVNNINIDLGFDNYKRRVLGKV